MPDKLPHEAKELLKQFDALTGDSLNAAQRATGDGDNDPGTGGKGKGKKKIWK